MKNDTVLECKQCGSRKRVNFEYVARNGWVQCCGESMHLEETGVDVPKVFAKIFRYGWREFTLDPTRAGRNRSS